jgi:hypothetical protein
MKSATFSFTVPEKANCSFKTLVVKETDGEDEAKAKALADANKTSLGVEIIKLAVVSLDGVPVEHPWLAFEKMSSKDRSFIGKAWERVNATPETLVNDFLESMTITV